MVRLGLSAALVLGLAVSAAEPHRLVSHRISASAASFAPDPAQALPPLERIAINDNRSPAGTLSGGVLNIRLEARTGHWFPDGDANPGLVVKAFALEGSPLQVPSPLIRVPEGTEVRAVVRNRLTEPLVIHGMYSRPASVEAAARVEPIPPGETREISFVAGRAGTYFYWGATSADTQLALRTGADSQLSGAIVVDPSGGGAAPDRVLVIGNWNNGLPNANPEARFRFVINGRSWPHTERFSYAVGHTVRMRLINAGAAVHPMHLHGFYFNVDSRGNEREDTVYPPGSSPRLVVTERMTPGVTFALTWKPTRPGNWLFHCHDNVHLDHGGPFDGSARAAVQGHRHVENHALEMMAGPVMGITVTGASAEPPEPATPPRRRRRIFPVRRSCSSGTSPSASPS